VHAFVVMLSLRGAAILARSPIRGIVEQVQPLPPLLLPRWKHLPDAIAGARGFEARTQLAVRWLRDQLGAAPVQTPQAYALADAIACHRLRGSVANLIEIAGLGERALQKQFSAEIGWTPKKLLGIARLQRVLRTLHPKPWSAATIDAWLEFSDQAHLSHDFKRLTGMSPSGFVRAKRASGDRLLHTVF
jgi:AraC-like DNA-binding protein